MQKHLIIIKKKEIFREHKRMKYKIFCTIFFCLIICFSFCFKWLQDTRKTAYIYIDPATTGAMFQMADLLKHPPKKPKYVAFSRFAHAMDKDFTQKHNIKKSKIETNPYEGNFTTILENEVQKFYEKHADYKFIIHANLFHTERTFAPILKIIPKKQIKKVYFYDDSIGRSLWDNWDFMNDYYAENFPTVFKLAFKEKLYERFPHIKNYAIEEQNISTLAKTLSEYEKKQLSHSIGFSHEMFNHLISNKDFVVYLDDPYVNVKKTFQHVDKLLKEKPELKNMVWVYKQHPRGKNTGPSYNALKKRVKHVLEINSKIPFEILQLTGCTPKFVLGYGSSVFFSLKKEEVLAYFERHIDYSAGHKDIYLPILQKLGILDTSNTVLVNREEQD